ncbi:hypothetical protein KIN20_004247 [Parelaphostrongylus tenuis]|uniref:Uncharacterized protein n=1 Tax=Parelaphostrongylus tenuis TaxID=148309 RepID=A0AAD5MR24_PARTN|nr:hypothetical protein KIN20_004247 [Parelaphostrongylus tenuis]
MSHEKTFMVAIPGESAAIKTAGVLEEGSHRVGLFPTVIPAILSRLSVENNYNLLHSTEAEANHKGAKLGVLALC